MCVVDDEDDDDGELLLSITFKMPITFTNIADKLMKMKVWVEGDVTSVKSVDTGTPDPGQPFLSCQLIDLDDHYVSGLPILGVVFVCCDQ